MNLYWSLCNSCAQDDCFPDDGEAADISGAVFLLGLVLSLSWPEEKLRTSLPDIEIDPRLS
jgi:hypothetical protein